MAKYEQHRKIRVTCRVFAVFFCTAKIFDFLFRVDAEQQMLYWLSN